MLVLGYKGNINKNAVMKSLSKHTGHSTSDVKTIVANIEAGYAVNLPDDFVLREELEDLNILIQ